MEDEVCWAASRRSYLPEGLWTRRGVAGCPGAPRQGV